MFLSILLVLKFILFTSLIAISFNRLTIVLFSSLLSTLIFFLIYRKKDKKSRLLGLIFYSLISLIMFLDAGYYAHFNSLPNILALKQAGQLRAVGDSLKNILSIKMILFLVDIPFAAYIILGSKYRPSIGRDQIKKYSKLTALALMGLILMANSTGKLPSLQAQELYHYHFLDIKDTLLGNSKGTSGLDNLEEEDLEDLKDRARLKEGKYTGIAKGKNLIVLQIEALQDFVIDLDYNGQEVTPYLNALVHNRSSLYYDDYHQLLGRGNTADAEFVSNNSLHPSMDEPSYFQFEDNSFYGLPWLLRDYGYNAWVFHGYEKEFWNRSDAYPNQGFQRFLSEEDYQFQEKLGFGIRDSDFYEQSIDYLKEMDGIDDNPFYAFIISLSSHTPFKMPEEYEFLRIKEEHKDNMVGDYLQSIHYADRELGNFIEGLKREGLYDGTAIAIYGDHFAISTNQEEAALMTELLGREYDFDEMMHIPLIIHIGGEELGERISTIGSQLDFYPTIANIMGVDNKKGLVFGRDLSNYQGENLVASQTYILKGSFIDQDYLFEISRDGIFEHSRALDRKTRKAIDLERIRSRSQEAIEEINKSNYILQRDYLKDLIYQWKEK